MSTTTNLIQRGLESELKRRGVVDPEAGAAKLIGQSTLVNGELEIGGQPADDYLNRFCSTDTGNGNANREPAWTPPDVETALHDVAVFEDWLSRDKAGCERAFAEYNDNLQKSFGFG